ncbi:pitrilysin family protein [Synechococcus sp. PCC 6312]|uniref:M16 family metallopeptidase n=1 Tax=Synechococcus sp. (strain ATCC 27167 / PCC 6312) TaxID=195253 RepID=UPI0003039753|nr:pitrilysin family protein [Synechococcus sp. PCC 6312]
MTLAASPKHYRDLTLPPLPEISLPKYERYQLANGLTVYLLPDHDWPIVRGTALIRVGSRWEPANQAGLADLTGDLMRNGGTRSHPIEELDALLADRAATIEAGFGVTAGQVSFTALREHVSYVFSWFSEVLQEPAFDPERIAVAQQRRRGQIARRNDTPESIASREFYRLIYGLDSPYSRRPEYATLARIDRQALVKFAHTYVQPSQMILGIVGDFEPKEMRTLIQTHFGPWEPTPQPLPPIPTVEQPSPPGTFIINQPQLSQSYIYTGHLGDTLRDADVFSLYVMNGVLNGFGGRLFNQIRSQQGLAYSVYAAWNPEYDYPGVFFGTGQTQTVATLAFLKSLQHEFQRLQTEPIQPAELAYAQDAILNSFIFNFRSPAQTLYRLMRYEYFGYDSDFIFQYQRGVKATTIADVQRVAQAHLQPEHLTTLIVGNQPALTRELPQFPQPIGEIDITIPNLS